MVIKLICDILAEELKLQFPSNDTRTTSNYFELFPYTFWDLTKLLAYMIFNKKKLCY